MSIYLLFLFYLFNGVYSDWIELPKVTPVQKSVQNVFLTLESTTSSILSLEQYMNSTEPTIKILEKFKNESLTNGLNLKENHIHQESKIIDDDTNADDLNYEIEVDDDETDNSIDEEDESQIVEETLQNAQEDLFKDQTKNVANKLEYLKQLQNVLSQQISKYCTLFFINLSP